MGDVAKWFAFIFAFTFTVFAGLSGVGLWKAHDAARWPSTTGVILENRVDRVRECHDEGGGELIGDSKCEWKFYGRVAYEYRVGAEVHRGAADRAPGRGERHRGAGTRPRRRPIPS
jgi:hypothetical protein